MVQTCSTHLAMSIQTVMFSNSSEVIFLSNLTTMKRQNTTLSRSMRRQFQRFNMGLKLGLRTKTSMKLK